MLKLVNHTEANNGGKHLKFPIASHPKGPYKHHIVVRVDAGADVNCINEKTFNELFPELQLSVCPHETQNFGNSVSDISILEQFHTYLEFRGEKYLNTFIVTNVNDCPNLLNYGATFRMGVLLPNYPQEIVVKGENVPHFSKMSGGKTGKGTLNSMFNGISYVNTGNSTVSSTSNGNQHSPNHTIKRKLRICLDPRDLNEALEREPYHTCSVDEITAKLQGMTVFTIVDFKKGYWIVLHPDSRKLTCMALPFGRFQWTRLSMGTVVAQDIFQSKLDSIFIGMEGVTGIADDMVIAGRDEMEHDRNFLAFMEKCMSNNLTL